MIYLKNTTDAQTCLIPRNGIKATSLLTLILRSTVNLEGPILEVDDINASECYSIVSVVLPGGLANGEYQYQLMSGEVLVSCGLCYIGDLQDPTQHESTITYQEYESE